MMMMMMMQYRFGELTLVGLLDLAHAKRRGRVGTQCVVGGLALFVLAHDKRVVGRLRDLVDEFDQIVWAVYSHALFVRRWFHLVICS